MITLPAYRAERTLAKTVADIPPGIADEVILVDDASPDSTVKVAETLGIRVLTHPENRGYGGNQKTCYRQALDDGADVVVLLHPDYQYDPKAVPLLIAPILAGDADMTFGSRFAGQGDPIAGGMPRYRFVGNRVTTVLENALLGSRFTEMHSGLRAYTRTCLLSLPFLRYRDDFSFDSQMLVDAATGGQRVVEVPIPTRYTLESSSIGIGRSLAYVAETLRYASVRSARRGRRGRRSPVAWDGPRRGRLLEAHLPVHRACVLCGATDQQLVCAATPATGEGDLVQCTACGMVSAVGLDRGAIEPGAPPALARRVLGSLGGYATAGRRLVELRSGPGPFLAAAGDAGWEADWADPEDGLPAGADAVVMLDVLDRLPDPVGTLRRVRGSLAGEGLVTLTTATLRGGCPPPGAEPRLHHFGPETLRSTLREAGFRLVEWDVLPRPLSGLAGAGRRLQDVVLVHARPDASGG